MIISVDPGGKIAGFKDLIDRSLEEKEVKGLFILSCDANGFTPEMVDPVLREIPLPVFGGIFPGIIHGKEKMDTGTIVVGIKSAVDINIIPGLSDKNADYDEIIDREIPGLGSSRTMFVFVDSMAKRLGSFISGLFNTFGAELNYVGGGAGSLSMKQKPCLFTNQGLIPDSAILARLDLESGVGVSHGYKSAAGPFKATETDGNIIRSLDWKPALEVYKKFVDRNAKKRLREDNFYDLAGTYPFGITKMGTERVVRDPVMIGENQTLICVGEVPEGSFIDIMKGSESSLLAAAARALDRSSKAFQGDKQKAVRVFMDCISRVLFLKENFNKELNAVYEEGIPLIGACTLGKIANSGSGYLEFYNKTAVVAQIEAE